MLITTLANATLRMDVGRRWSNTSGAQVLVACNVYVSAGRCHHADLLLKVLNSAQVSDHVTEATRMHIQIVLLRGGLVVKAVLFFVCYIQELDPSTLKLAF
jgi:hypothetical protein